jgi:DNA-binding transcriptional ArsR family regulator
MKLTLRFTYLRQLLQSTDLTPAVREHRVQEMVELILEEVPDQPEEDQMSVRAALHTLGVLPEQRSVHDRREGQTPPPGMKERRRGQDRRRDRPISEWLGDADEDEDEG